MVVDVLGRVGKRDVLPGRRKHKFVVFYAGRLAVRSYWGVDVAVSLSETVSPIGASVSRPDLHPELQRQGKRRVTQNTRGQEVE